MATKTRTQLIAAGVLAVVVLGAFLLGAMGTMPASGDTADTQEARLYELQAAFHAAATLRDPNDLDRRIVDMLALWTNDGALTLGGNTFNGKGDPGTASCAPGSGTLCDFFTNVAPPFQNRWISLAPSYRTKIEVQGNTATLSYECRYFDEEWAPMAQLAVAATAEKSGGDWKLASAVVTPIAPPAIPYP